VGTKFVYHVDHLGGPVLRTKLRPLARECECGLRETPLVGTLFVHQVARLWAGMRLTRARRPLGPKGGPADTPFVGTQWVDTVIHPGALVFATVHGATPVPKDGSGWAPGLAAVTSTSVPLTLWLSGPGTSGVRARVAHIHLELRILRPPSTNEFTRF